MKKRRRKKKITKRELAEIIKPYDWMTRKLVESKFPEFLESIPRDIVLYVAASGSFEDLRNTVLEDEYYDQVVAGIDVIRCDEKDLRIEKLFKKDHYVVIMAKRDSNYLIVEGPFKDHEHWLKELPEWLDKAEYLTFDEDSEGNEKLC